MTEPTQIDDFIEHLREIRDALDEGDSEGALELLLEIREGGVHSPELDEQIQTLGEESAPEAITAVRPWVQNLIGQIQNQQGGFSGLEEISDPSESGVSAEELIPMSESDDVGLEVKDFEGGDVSLGGMGSDVHSEIASDSEADSGDDSDFSRETQPVTAVGHDSLASLDSSGFGSSERQMEGADAGFDRLPSVDFSVVESEAEDESLSESDELEPIDFEEDSDLGIFDSADGGDPEEEEFEFESEEDEELLEDDGFDELFGESPTENDSQSADRETRESDIVAEEDEIDFQDYDDVEETEDGLLEPSDPDEWSALDAFDSSELEAGSSDFDFEDSEPGVETVDGEPVANQDEKETANQGDLAAEVDNDSKGDELDVGVEEGSEELGDEKSYDPNKTRQPFSNQDEVDMYAKQSFRHPSEVMEASDPFREAGDEESSPGSDEPADSEPPAFQNERPTAKSQVPEETGETAEGDEDLDLDNDADDGADFDLGFENPGEDDAASFDLDMDGEDDDFGWGDDEESEESSPSADGDAPGQPDGLGIGESEPEEDLESASDPVSQSSGGPRLNESGARYDASSPGNPESTANSDEDVEELMNSGASESGSGEPLSEEEFFNLADELSGVNDGGGGGGGAGNPTPHRGEPVVPGESGMAGAEPSGVSSNGQSAPGASGPGSSLGSSSSAAQSQHRKASAEASRDLATGAVRLIDEAESLVEKGKLDSAHDLVQSVLDGAPNSERAKALLREIREKQNDESSAHDRETAESDQVPPLEAIPRREMALEDIAEKDFDHRFGFILSLVDGTVTVEDVLELSSMSRSETMSVLSDMIEQAVLTIEE